MPKTRRVACPRRVARRGGFEPPTPRFVVWCSIQLSYRRTGLAMFNAFRVQMQGITGARFLGEEFCGEDVDGVDDFGCGKMVADETTRFLKFDGFGQGDLCGGFLGGTGGIGDVLM